MKKSELRKIIREEIQKELGGNEHEDDSQISRIEMMEGQAHMKTLAMVRNGMAELCNSWLEDGFTIHECIDYFNDYIQSNYYR